MPKAPKSVPMTRFRLNQAWNGSCRGDIITVGPGLLDALRRGCRGDVVDAADEPAAKMVRAAPLNKSMTGR